MSRLVIYNCIVCPMYENAVRQVNFHPSGVLRKRRMLEKKRTIQVFICKHPDRGMPYIEEGISDERFGELCNDVSHDCPLRENPLQLSAKIYEETVNSFGTI